jgi:hypothetical protein
VLEEKNSQARMALAWLQLWEQSELHPQKPWSNDFLKAEKGFSTIRLAAQQQQEIIAFDLEQARNRLQFLEKLQTEGNYNE